MPLRRLLLILCAAAFVAGTVTAPAGAQSGSGPLLSPPTETVDTNPPPDESHKGDGLSAFQQLLILLGAAGLIGGIGFAIWRDARKNAPADAKRQLSDEEAGGPSKSRQRARERDKRRAKAKQARKQRKRNR